MTFDDVLAALEAGASANRVVDHNVHGMAKLIAGRLRASGSLDWKTKDAFKALKAELRNFDSRTGCWRDS